MDVVNQQDAKPFVTADGATIRELLAHRNSAIRRQSLAEARLAPGAATTPHHHVVTEEIYYILSGTADMTIDQETRGVGPGDAIAIPVGGFVGEGGGAGARNERAVGAERGVR